MAQNSPSWFGRAVAEFLGTFLLVFIGDMAIAAAVLGNAYDLTGVALMWGMGVVFAIYIVGAISGAHLNPAVSLAMASLGKLPWGKVPTYISAQVAGAFMAALGVYICWESAINAAVTKMGVEIGAPGTQKLAMIFACYYPNPAMFGTEESGLAQMATGSAFMAEVLMTAILVMVILAVLNERNALAPKSNMAPLFIGLTVMAMVGIGGAATMTAINPARDFGPRLFSLFVGFGKIAFPGPQGHEFWLYIIGPIIGGLLGGQIYQKAIVRFLGGAKS